MTRMTFSQALGISAIPSFGADFTSALDQRATSGMVITGSDVRELLAQAEPLDGRQLEDLKQSVRRSLTRTDGWSCDPQARQSLADFIGVPADSLPPAVQPSHEQLAAEAQARVQDIQSTLDNLHQLAPELSSESRNLLDARRQGLPSTTYDGSKGGVLNLMQQQVPSTAAQPAAAAQQAYPDPAVEMLEQVYGKGAAQQLGQLELSMLRTEIALLAALQGASLEQIRQILGDDSPAARELAALLQQLASALLSGSMDPEAVDHAMQRCRDGFVNHAAGRSGIPRAQARRLAENELGVTRQPRPSGEPFDPSKVPPGTDFPPGSEKTRALFREAAKLAGVPESWADSPGLHNILKRESNGMVGIPNYTYGSRKKDPSQWATVHNELKSGRITAKSSATGLGQLLLRNVDRYYPNGRAGIGDPVQEAAGMLAYIKDRYGSPERAWALYGKLHEGY